MDVDMDTYCRSFAPPVTARDICVLCKHERMPYKLGGWSAPVARVGPNQKHVQYSYVRRIDKKNGTATIDSGDGWKRAAANRPRATVTYYVPSYSYAKLVQMLTMCSSRSRKVNNSLISYRPTTISSFIIH